MLKLILQHFLLICLFLSTSTALAAPRFIATVDINQVMLGETLTLKLELSDTSASGEPDLSQLENRFEIYGQQQFQSTQIINGQVSSQLVWQYTLEPQKTGVLTIPSLTIKTSAGYLHSQPIRIVVSKTPVRRSDNVRLEARVSNPNPYLHQPILYTLLLYHRGNLRELEPIPPSDNVIMEQLGKFTQRRVVKHGKQMIEAQISYLLTPLRSGKLELGAKMKGLKPDTRNNQFSNNLFSFGTNYRPTTISSAPLTLDVQPPTSQQHAWLPLNNLTLEQKWESDISKPVMAGTPLIRTLTLVAKGMGGQSPPQLESFVESNTDFRVRTPKPETERSLLADKTTPVSKITQGFSLIPLNTGRLQLPAIRIPWWDVQKKQWNWAELPAQIIEVIPNQNYMTPANALENMANTAANSTVPNEVSTEPTIVSQSVPPSVYYFSQTQYAFLAMAISALLIALWQSWYTRRKQVVTAPVNDTKLAQMSHATFKKRLASLNELAAIKQLIQEYAHLRWQIPVNASLQTIAQYLTRHYENATQITDLFKELNAALYGKQTFDLREWKQRCVVLLTNFKEKQKLKREQENKAIFVPLNPA